MAIVHIFNVSDQDPITQDIPEEGRRFFGDQLCCMRGDKQSISRDETGAVVGVFRYRTRGWRTVISSGVWVAPSARGQGIAKSLVSGTLKYLKRSTLKGYSVSPGGQELLRSLKSEFRVVDGNKELLV